MKKNLLNFLLVYLMVIPAFLSFGQKMPSTPDLGVINIFENQSALLNSNGYQTPVGFKTTAVNSSEISDEFATDAFEQGNLTAEFSTWNKSTKGFSQDTATVLYTADFDPRSDFTPYGWYVAGTPSTNWRTFNHSSWSENPGGTQPYASFYSSPIFNGYTKMVIDTTLNTSAYTNLAFSFKTIMKLKTKAWTARIETTSDGGETWNTAWEKLVNSNFGPDSLLIIINTPDVGSENFQFALSVDGTNEVTTIWKFDDIVLTEGPEVVSDITFNIIGLDSTAVENARVTVEGYGTLFTDNKGQVVFKNVVPGNYDYNITAENLKILKDTLVLAESDLTLDIYMEDPIYLYYEDFTVEPNGWQKHLPEENAITWIDEAMRFTSSVEGEMLYVTPEIDLYKDTTIVIEVGKAYNGGTIGVGIVTDPKDSTTYTEIAQFDIEASFKYFDLVLPEEYETAKHLGFKRLGPPGKDFSLTTFYLEPKDAYEPRIASFIVKDMDGNFVKDAQVTVEANGTKSTDSLGQVSFNSVYEGTYEWAVNAGIEYSRSSGTLIIEENDTIINVEMQVPAYYFFDDFMEGQINEWTFHNVGAKGCAWNNGAIFFYHSDDIPDPLYAVSPEVDLSKVASVTAYLGKNTNGSGTMVFGTLSNPKDKSTFTPLTSFNVGLAYQYFTVNITEYTGTDKYFGFQSFGPNGNFHYMPTVFMEAKPTALKYPVTFVVKDENNLLYEGAKIVIPGFGPVFTDSEGKAIINLYNNKSFEYTVSGDGLFDRVRTVTVDDAAKTVSVPMKIKGDYYMLEEFTEGIPYTWNKIVTSSDGIEWWNGQVQFYNQLDSDDPMMIVSPEIILTKVDAITVENGVELSNEGTIVIGSMTDPANPETFVELGSIESQYELEFHTIDVSNIDIQGSYLGFKIEGKVLSYQVIKTIYVEGSGVTEYCMDSSLNKDGWISNVEFDDINNASDWQPEVGDYTHMTTRLQEGKSELITVSNGNPKATDVVTAWVDWDQNFEFEAETGEEYMLSSTDDGATFTAEITVPEGIEYGKFQLRIRMTNGTTVAPCGELNNGETEDYVLKVAEERYAGAGIAFEDNFDSYLVDDYVAYQNPEVWNTSNNNNGGGKDVLVSSAQAYSGTNAANVIKGDDIIMEFEKYLSLGKHSVSAMIQVPTNGEAYYALHSAYGAVEELAFEVNFLADGTGSVNAGGTDAATFTFSNDIWIASKIIIDLANDSAEFLLDGASVLKWQYTAGADGEGCASQFAALRLSGNTDASNYFIDDVVIETIAVYPPLGFSAELVDGFNIEMNWGAPLGEEKIRWDNGTTNWGLGFGGGAAFFAVSRWNPEELKSYDENYITSITFYPRENAAFTLKAWIGETAETLILSQEVDSVKPEKFNTIELETPIKINAFDDIWFGYEVSGYGGSPAGYDYGPAVQGKGNLMSTDGGASWYTLADHGRDFNWNLAASVSPSANGKTLAKPMTKENITSATDFSDEASLLPEVTEHIESKAKESSSNTKVADGFVGYNVYRNGDLIVDSLTKTTFKDTSLLPGTYSYEVKAVFNEGISASAMPGAIEHSIGEVVPRDLVVVEIRTGTWCQYCPGAALAVDEFIEHGDRVAVIEYHTNDDYTTAETNARLGFYEETGAPTAWFDGRDAYSGGNASTSIYSSYKPKYDKRIAVPSVFELKSSYYPTEGDNYILDISMEMIETHSNLNNIKLFAALTESHIEEIWMGLDELNFVCRDLIPDANGTATDFTDSNSQSLKLDFSIPEDYDKDHTELVVFIQDVVTKEILQGTIALEGTPPFGIPANLTGPASAIINTDIVLTWDAVDAGGNTLTGYNVYRKIGDVEFTLLGKATEATYTDNISEKGIANYYVTAVYDEGESDASNTLTVDITTNIEESIFNNTVLYPNPATQVVNITSDYLMEAVVVYNYVGQEVLMESINNTSYRINTSDFDAGIYLFQIETQMGRIAKQIIIE